MICSRFLGLLSFAEAQAKQQEAWAAVRGGNIEGKILGFEVEPTVTLGARGGPEDVLWPEEEWRARGFAVAHADRGGHATLHNPGQLVIFPTLNIRTLGVRRFVDLLSEVSRTVLAEYGTRAYWNDKAPGLYTERGKIVSIGLRVRAGVSTHGIAINVRNDLAPFSGIRVCGRQGLAVDRLRTDVPLGEIFAAWAREFRAQLTTTANSHNLGSDSSMRL